MIIEWTRDEEAKYQASLVSKEVEKFKSGSDQSPASSRPSSSKSKKSSPSPEKPPKKKPSDKDKEKEKGITGLLNN